MTKLNITINHDHRLLSGSYALEYKGESDEVLMQASQFSSALQKAYPFLMVYGTTIDREGGLYHLAVRIPYEDSKITVGVARYDHTTKEWQATPPSHLKASFTPSKFRLNKEGKGKLGNVMKYVADLMQTEFVEDSGGIKDLQTTLKQKTYHIYSSTTKMVELAQLVNERTNSRSCMMKANIEDTLDTFRDSVIQNYEGEDVWIHPFRMYEVNDYVDEGDRNEIVLVSTEKLEDGGTYTKSPFVARAFVMAGGYTKIYGDTYAGSSSSINKFYKECSYNEGSYVMLYEHPRFGTVGAYCDFNADYAESTQSFGASNTTLGLDGTLCVMRDCENDCDQSEDVWQLTQTCGFGLDTYYFEHYVTCAVTDDEVLEDDACYIEHRDMWVEQRFARWNRASDRWELDGDELFDYYN